MHLTLYTSKTFSLPSLEKIKTGNVALTPREIDILSCLSNGRTSQKLIAEILSVSPRTAEKHIQSATQKILLNTGRSVHEFIENSGKVSTLRIHYEELLRKHHFSQMLFQLEKIHRKNKYCVNLEIVGCKKYIQHEIVRHLNSAGISVGEEGLKLQILIVEQDDVENAKEVHSNLYSVVIEILSHLLKDNRSGKILHNTKANVQENSQNKTDKVARSTLTSKNKKVTWVPVSSILAIGLLFFVYAIYFSTDGEKYWIGNVVIRDGGQQMEMPLPVSSKLLERKQHLSEIDRILSTQNPKTEITYVGIIGVGGAGKTILARTWAKKYASIHSKSVVWEINAESLESYKSSIKELSIVLADSTEKKVELKQIEGLSNRDERDKQVLLFVQANLKLRPNWLLILDNLESVSTFTGYIPTNAQIWGVGNIILTSRNKNIASSDLLSKDEVINLEDLSQDEAYQLFSKIRYGSHEALSDKEILDIKQYLKEVPAFPLDISLAANSGELSDYVFRLSHMSEEVNQIQQRFLKDISHYPNTRYGIVALTCDKLIESHESYKEILLLLSLLETNKIPCDLIGGVGSHQFTEEAIIGLQRYSLINFDTHKDLQSTFSLHRSTQDMLRAHLIQRFRLNTNDDLVQKVIENIIRYVNGAIDQENRAVLNILAPHLQKLISSEVVNEAQKLRLQGALGCIYYYIGNVSQSIELLDTVTRKLEDARMFMHLGAAHRLKSQFKESEAALKKSISVYQQKRNISGEVDAVLSLSHMYLGQGRYLEANDLTESVKEAVLDPEVGFMPRLRMHWVRSLVYRELGKYDDSILEVNKSIQLLDGQKIRDDRYLIALRLLAQTLGEKDNFSEGIAKFKEVISDFERRNVEDNYYWQTVSQLSNIFRKSGQYPEAKDGFYKTLKYYQENPEKNDLEIAWCYAELSKLLSHLGDATSLNYIEKAYDAYLGLFQEKSLRAAWISLVRGQVLVNLGKLTEAKNYLEVALERHQSLLGDEHPKTAKAKIYLGYCLFKLNEESGVLMLKAGKDTYEDIYGSEHLRIAMPSRLLAECYLEKKEFNRAEEECKASIKIFEKAKHPDICFSLHTSSQLILAKGNHEESRKIAERGLNEAKRVFPNNSPIIQRLETLVMQKK